MLKIYDPRIRAARRILKRQPLDDMAVPPAVQERIARLFGEPLTPAQAVERILADVRARGDAALREWSMRLDGAAARPASASPRASCRPRWMACPPAQRARTRSWRPTACGASTRRSRSPPG